MRRYLHFSLVKFFFIQNFHPPFFKKIILFLSHWIHVPRTCSCLWETVVLLRLMAKCHIFLSIYIFFTQCFTLFLSWLVCKWVFPVYVWWILSSLFVSGRCYHSISPPCRGICPPHLPTLHICSCVFAIAASCSQPPYFFLFYPWGATTENKGEKVAQFPPL